MREYARVSGSTVAPNHAALVTAHSLSNAAPAHHIDALFTQRVLDGLRIDVDAFARVAQQADSPQAIHLKRHDFTRRSHVIRDGVVRERSDVCGTVRHGSAQGLR